MFDPLVPAPGELENLIRVRAGLFMAPMAHYMSR